MHFGLLPDPAVHKKLLGIIASAWLLAVSAGILAAIISVIQKSVCKLPYVKQECAWLAQFAYTAG